MITGNAVADEVAGLAAAEARVPAVDRARMLVHERRARLVRMRILRATLDSMDADGKAPRQKTSSSSIVVPPSAASCSLFSTSHCLDDTGRGCTRCRGSASAAKTVEWRSSPCFKPVHYNGVLWFKPPNAPLHLAGGRVHESHNMQLHGPLKVWYCRDCGSFGSSQIIKLGKPCLRRLTPSGTEYLDRISRGLWPKA